MTRTTERKLERLLTGPPVGDPPPELRDRLIDDIPAEIELHPDLADTRVVRFPGRPWRLAAAAAAVVALTASVTWRLIDRVGPTEATLEHFRSGPAAEAPATDAEALGAEEPARSEARVDASSDELEGAAAAARERSVSDDSERDAAKPAVPQAVDVGATGKLQLEVTDEQGAALPGVTIQVVSGRAGNGRRTVISDARGQAELSGLPEGEYQVEAELSGFERKNVQGVKVGTDDDAARQLTLRPSEFAEEIAVISEAPATDVTAAAAGVVLSPSSPPPAEGVSEESRALGHSDSATAPGRETGVAADKKPEALRARDRELESRIQKLSAASPDALARARERGRLTGPGLAPSSTGGTDEPNDAPYGDVFFSDYGVNPFVDTSDDPLSTFGLEVDTAAYTVIRRYLADGHLPPREAVRVEEVVNFLDYGDPPPRAGDVRLSAEGAPSPYAENDAYRVLRFGVRFRDVDTEARPAAVLTFVVDVSGSMAREDRLGLVKRALASLLANLRSDDRVGLVVYGSRGEVLLEPTTDHEMVRRAIDRLAPGGSTNAEEGLLLGYRMADEFHRSAGINRVILCSDGVANVGRTGPDSILARIRSEAGRGIELTTVGFGMGNYNDVLMEQLADAGDGRYAYVDTFKEARRLFVEELTGTLLTVAHDAKVQVEFDPRTVSRWRLLGYENRDIADERFRDPTVDAGEIGAGHAATAVYEVKLREPDSTRGTVATLRLRYQPSRGAAEVEVERRLEVRDLARHWSRAPVSLRLAASAAELGERLKGSYWARSGSWKVLVDELERLARDRDGDPTIAELAELARIAKRLADSDVGNEPEAER